MLGDDWQPGPEHPQQQAQQGPEHLLQQAQGASGSGSEHTPLQAHYAEPQQQQQPQLTGVHPADVIGLAAGAVEAQERGSSSSSGMHPHPHPILLARNAIGHVLMVGEITDELWQVYQVLNSWITDLGGGDAAAREHEGGYKRGASHASRQAAANKHPRHEAVEGQHPHGGDMAAMAPVGDAAPLGQDRDSGSQKNETDGLDGGERDLANARNEANVLGDAVGPGHDRDSGNPKTEANHLDGGATSHKPADTCETLEWPPGGEAFGAESGEGLQRDRELLSDGGQNSSDDEHRRRRLLGAQSK